MLLSADRHTAIYINMLYVLLMQNTNLYDLFYCDKDLEELGMDCESPLCMSVTGKHPKNKERRKRKVAEVEIPEQAAQVSYTQTVSCSSELYTDFIWPH